MSCSDNITLRSDLPEWISLSQHKEKTALAQIKELFSEDAKRFENFHARHEGILLDYSKNNITQETIDLLLSLAKACDLEEWREKMFSGAVINDSEQRAVLHTALRQTGDSPIYVDGDNIIPQIRSTLDQVKNFSNKVREEKKYKHIVNIGIGGSDLGSAMVYNALKPFCDPHFQMHFISNMDAAHLLDALETCDPEQTLFIVTSKTFSTSETITNALSAKAWIEKHLGSDKVGEHFVGITKNMQRASDFGIKEDHIFPIWDWVGGRYSLWSAVGLPCAIALGYTRFKELLNGAHSMDRHFFDTPLHKNMPVLMAMIGIWHRNFCKFPAITITPYAQHLSRFGPYIQGLDMESNGKSVDRQNRRVPYDTGPVILGETGTNAQHAFFQLVHQGTTIIPCDFIAVTKPQHDLQDHNIKLLANALGQSEALMIGKDDPNPHKAFDGNRPSNTILMDELTPYNLGMLLALYEHKIFVQGVIWNINSFDQCGVELGKELANDLLPRLRSDDNAQGIDTSTASLIHHIKHNL